jgi:predicted MFS family arabinose efflux permease
MVDEQRRRALPAAVWWAAAAFATLLGFSRISFGLLLPFIKHDFPASYTEYGIVASANFAGYLAGLIGTTLLPRRFHDRRSNVLAIWTIAMSLALSAAAPNLAIIAGARFINGIAQAVATMLTIGLTLSIVPHELRGRASGILWGGGGAGIVLCALSLPYAGSADTGWRFVWLVMALVTAAVVFGLQRVLPERAASPAKDLASAPTDRIAIAILCVQYFFFGAGFADYFTYAPAFAREIVTSSGAFAVAWIIMGVAGMVGGSLWGHFLDGSRRGMTLGASLLVTGIGAFALLIPDLAAAAASAILVGGGSFGVPAQTTALARRFSSADQYVYALSVVTATFGLGQTLGAPLAGWLADAHGLGSAIALSAVIFAAGGLVALGIALRAERRTPAHRA